MSTRIDDLEKNIGELMNQAGVDDPEKWWGEMERTAPHRTIGLFALKILTDTFIEDFKNGAPVIHITSVGVTEFWDFQCIPVIGNYNFCWIFFSFSEGIF